MNQEKGSSRVYETDATGVKKLPRQTGKRISSFETKLRLRRGI